MEVKRVSCYMCWMNCGLLATVDDNGRVVKTEGDPNSIMSGGWTCERQKALMEYHYHKDRINYPMKRVEGTKRGDGKYERISWDEAMDEIAKKLLAIKEKYGPEALASFGGTTHGPGDEARYRFFNKFGSPNFMNQGKNCGSASMNSEVPMAGYDSMGAVPVPGLTQCCLAAGVNSPQSGMMTWSGIRSAQEKGMKLVVIDPRFTEMASYADLWLQLRPGTDAALYWGMIAYIIDQDLVDHDFIDNWTKDYDLVVEEAKNWPLTRAAEITEVPAEKIAQAAYWYATAKPANDLWGLTACHMGNAGNSVNHAHNIIHAITGNVDVMGGNWLTGPNPNLAYADYMEWDTLLNHPDRKHDCATGHKFMCNLDNMVRINESVEKAWGHGHMMCQYFMYPSPVGIYDGILKDDPYPIRAFIVEASNPLCTLTGGKHAYEAFKSDKLELLVGMDYFMTPSLCLCDYILPAADCLERENCTLMWGSATLTLCTDKAVEPMYERKNDYDFWAMLGRRVGQDWPEDYKGFINEIIKPTGFTFEELAAREDNYVLPPTSSEDRRYLQHGFGTPSGKYEFRPTLLEEAGVDPFPKYEEIQTTKFGNPALAEKYPFTMMPGNRNRPYWHSSFRQLKSLRWMQPYPICEINAEDARRLGIGTDDWVWIETDLGRVKQKAKVTADVKPGVITAEAYWYYPELPIEEPWLMGWNISNVDTIIGDDYELCDWNGDQPMRDIACNIYRCETALNETNIGPCSEIFDPFTGVMGTYDNDSSQAVDEDARADLDGYVTRY